MADARKSLPMLRDEWSSCVACALGQRRKMVGAPLVFGQGSPGGVLFVAEGPNQEDEALGLPCAGDAGQILLEVLKRLNFKHYYVTHLVACRSCESVIDPATGTPRMRKRRGFPDEIFYRDVGPNPLEIEACLPRLHEEIYLVDPTVIVALGATAAAALLGTSVTITRDRGRTQECSIPGATWRPVHTDKRKVWGRKAHGKMNFPVEQNQVRYLVLPTYSLLYVFNKIGDRGKNSPVKQFTDDVRAAVKIHDWHMLQLLGKDVGVQADADLTSIGENDE